MTNRPHITMEDAIGTKVLIHLHRQAYEMLDLQGVDSEKFVAKVVGMDAFGLWVENPNYTTVPVYDDDGAYIPPEKREPVKHRAVVLLQWPYIQTILQFPDRVSFTGGLDEEEFGFKSKVKTKEDKRG